MNLGINPLVMLHHRAGSTQVRLGRASARLKPEPGG